WSCGSSTGSAAQSPKSSASPNSSTPRGVGLHILTGTLEGTYTPTGSGKFFFTIMAAFAELERHLIHERTLAGLAAARAQGRIGGRPRKLTDDTLIYSVAFSPDGHTVATGSADNTARLWDVTDPHHPSPLATLTGHTNAIHGVAFRRD